MKWKPVIYRCFWAGICFNRVRDCRGDGLGFRVDGLTVLKVEDPNSLASRLEIMRKFSESPLKIILGLL